MRTRGAHSYRYVRARVTRPRSSVRPPGATSFTPPDAAWRGGNDCAQYGRQTPSTSHTRAQRSDRSGTTPHARAHTHVIADDIDGVGVELGGRWPVRKLGLELEEHGAQSCTCHLGWGETLDDPDCPAAVRSGQWGSGTPSTRRSTAIATTTCLPR